jgi:hypothetical protein
MKYAAEISSGAMIYTPRFIKIGSGFRKLMGGINTHTHTHTASKSHKPTFIF